MSLYNTRRQERNQVGAFTEKTKSKKTLNDRFIDVADWVSSGMGSPANIIVWMLIVIGWTGLYMVHPELQNVNFLPSWFTSQSYNFPLNLVTTVLELFIGFFLAASSNRVEKRNRELHVAMLQMIKHIEELEEQEEKEIMQLLSPKKKAAKKSAARAKK